MSEQPSPAPTRNERVQQAIQEAIATEAAKTPEKTEATKAEVAKAEPPATSGKTAEPAKTPERAEDKAFAKLMQEKAALRQQGDQLRPWMEAAKAMDPNSLAALARAKAAGDPMAALAAMGFNYTDLAKRVAGMKEAPKEDDEEPGESGEPEYVRKLKEEVAGLKQEVTARKTAEMKVEMLGKMKTLITADKFKFVTGHGDFDAVLRYLEDFHSKTGSLPGESFEESVELAATAVEKHLEAQAEKWRKVLTPSPAPTTVLSEATSDSVSVGQAHTGRTLTNAATTSPKSVAPEPKSREEKLKALIADPTVPW